MEDKQNTSVKNASEEAFDVTGFFLECISYWKWFVASVVVLAVAVMFYCFRQTPVYEVTSAVYIQDNKGDNSNILLESLGLSSYKKNKYKEEMADITDALLGLYAHDGEQLQAELNRALTETYLLGYYQQRRKLRQYEDKKNQIVESDCE